MNNYIDLSSDKARSIIPDEVLQIMDKAPKLIFPNSREDLLELAFGGKDNDVFEVEYDVPGIGRVLEATVTKCKNGAAVNYVDIYMLRRDPDCMVIGDDKTTDKPRYRDKYGADFDPMREMTFDWLSSQELIIMPFFAGSLDRERGYGALLVAPANAGFFAAGLGDLQGAIPSNKIPEDFEVKLVLYLAPPFRHTHFDGKQIVVHNRKDTIYEIFSYNLYPGPSAKKGVYGALLSVGIEEGWSTLHGSCVQVVTPYENIISILHEGASGGGKSELLEYAHRQEDGRLLLGENVCTGEKLDFVLGQGCHIKRVCDDMAICPKNLQGNQGWLVVEDAEEAWFIRLDHIKSYGTDPHLESWTIHPKESLIFLNVEGIPRSTCLIWEHIQDEPGKPCPNPRVIMPRHLIPDTINTLTEVHYRNFGIRTPPCTSENPSYGIIGYLHLLPPSLAWLWRLVAPRGHANPSITDSSGLSSGGVGSYWPFASGRSVDHANLLLEQMEQTPLVRYTLTPNQHVGAWKTSFMPQWIVREYLARRGLAVFNTNDLHKSRCSLLGYGLNKLKLEGQNIPEFLLRVEEQPEIGIEAYDKGAKILHQFFVNELQKFLVPDLSERGRKIIECCMDNGSVDDYEGLLNF
ncbi:MAG: DUF4914 family protein [Armatimonadota bacterium]